MNQAMVADLGSAALAQLQSNALAEGLELLQPSLWLASGAETRRLGAGGLRSQKHPRVGGWSGVFCFFYPEIHNVGWCSRGNTETHRGVCGCFSLEAHFLGWF